MTGVFIRERQGRFGIDIREDTEQRRRPCEDRSRDWKDSAISQGTSRISGATEAAWGKGRSSPRAFGRSTDLLTPCSDFWSPELKEEKFLLLSVIKFGVICCSSHRKLILVQGCYVIWPFPYWSKAAMWTGPSHSLFPLSHTALLCHSSATATCSLAHCRAFAHAVALVCSPVVSSTLQTAVLSFFPSISLSQCHWANVIPHYRPSQHQAPRLGSLCQFHCKGVRFNCLLIRSVPQGWGPCLSSSPPSPSYLHSAWCVIDT